MTYGSRYLSLIQSRTDDDLLVHDESNPRSLRFNCKTSSRFIGTADIGVAGRTRGKTNGSRRI